MKSPTTVTENGTNRHSESALRRGTAWALIALLTLGCTTYTAIKPTELPKLNGSFSAPVAANGQLVAVRVAQVERPDGTLVEVRGEFDVRVTVRGLGEREFTHPVRASVDPTGTAILIAGGNASEETLPLNDIVSVEVSQPDVAGSYLAYVLVAGGSAAALVLVLLAAG